LARRSSKDSQLDLVVAGTESPLMVESEADQLSEEIMLEGAVVYVSRATSPLLPSTAGARPKPSWNDRPRTAADRQDRQTGQR
jgi:hypothetical protein